MTGSVAAESGDQSRIDLESSGPSTVETGSDATFEAFPYSNDNETLNDVTIELVVDEDKDGDFEQVVGSEVVDLEPGSNDAVSVTYEDVDLDPDTYDFRLQAVWNGQTYVNFVDVTTTVEGDGPAGPNADIRKTSQTGPRVELVADRSEAGDAPIDTYEWDFGDGSTGDGVVGTHVYDEPGNYTVTLTVTDEDGLTDSAELTVDVGSDDEDDEDGESDESDGSGDGDESGETDESDDEDDQPDRPDLRSIQYGQTKTGYVDAGDPEYDEFLGGVPYEPVTFTGEKGDIVGIDVEGVDGRLMTLRVYGPEGRVEFSEGGYVLPDDGEYTVRVSFWSDVTNLDGVGEYEFTLTRQGGEAPAVAIDVVGDPGVNSEVTFVASATGDDAVESYEWDLGNGVTGTGEEFRFTPTQAGELTVELTATDEDGDSRTIETRVEVETELVNRFDEDDDGLNLNELNDALEEVQSDDYDGDLTVRDIRRAIDEHSVDSDPEVPEAIRDDSGESEVEDVDNDGLATSREKRGIPVLEKNVEEEADIGEGPNVTTLESDPPGIVRLQTDPFDEDTDGDGLKDGTELGKPRIISGSEANDLVGTRESVLYYPMSSDPTDPNSDDAGLGDQAELKHGSDPMTPTHFSLNLVFPVQAQQNCDPGDPPDVQNCAADVGSDNDLHELVKLDEFNYNEGDNPDKRPWLNDISDSRLEEGKTYYLVAVEIQNSGAVSDTEDLPSGVLFEGFTHRSAELVGAGPAKDEVVDSWLFDPYSQGANTDKTAYLVVEHSGELDNSLHQSFGSLRVKVQTPSDSPYARGNPAGPEENRIYTTEMKFAVEDGVPYTSPGEARALVREASRKFAIQMAAAVFPATAGAIGARSFYALTRGWSETVVLMIADGVALYTGVGDIPAGGPDDFTGRWVAGEGAVPVYLENGDDDPTTAVALTVHRAN